MADLPLVTAISSANEEPLPDLSKLRIDDSVKDEGNKMCLSDLHQVYIDEISKHLDPKSIVRLQLTCKDLFHKGYAAQRLVDCPVNLNYKANGKLYIFYRDDFRVCWTREQFAAMNFHFKAHVTAVRDFFLEDFEDVSKILEGKGTIEKIFTGDIYFPPVDGFALLNHFLEKFKVDALSMMDWSEELFQLPAVKQMKYIAVRGVFPLSLRYFLDTQIRSCDIYLPFGRMDNSEQIHNIFEAWARNDKVIEDLKFRTFVWDEDRAFAGWRVINQDQEIPSERPVAIREVDDEDSIIKKKYRVIRADDARLSVEFKNDGWSTLLHLECLTKELENTPVCLSDFLPFYC